MVPIRAVCPLEYSHRVRFSPNTAYPGGPMEIPAGAGESHTGGPVLALQALIRSSAFFIRTASLDPAVAPGFAVAGSCVAPQPKDVKTLHMVSEEEILKAKCLTDGVIRMLIRSRKTVTRAIYLKV